MIAFFGSSKSNGELKKRGRWIGTVKASEGDDIRVDKIDLRNTISILTQN